MYKVQFLEYVSPHPDLCMYFNFTHSFTAQSVSKKYQLKRVSNKAVAYEFSLKKTTDQEALCIITVLLKKL